MVYLQYFIDCEHENNHTKPSSSSCYVRPSVIRHQATSQLCFPPSPSGNSGYSAPGTRIILCASLMVYLSCHSQLIKISVLKVNHCWFYTPLVYDSHLFWGVSFIFPELWLVLFLPSGHSLRAETLTERNSYVSGSPLDEFFLNWIGIAIARWRRTSAHALWNEWWRLWNIQHFPFCSRMLQWEWTGRSWNSCPDTIPSSLCGESLSFGGYQISLLLIDQTTSCGSLSFQLGRNYLDWYIFRAG